MATATAFHEIAPAQDRALELAKFVASCDEQTSAALVQQYRRLIEANDFTSFLLDVLDAHDAVFQTGSDDDIEGAFTLILSFLSLVDAQKHSEIVAKLSRVASSVTDKHATVRLRILANLYNALTEKQAKLSAFTQLLAYAASTKQLELLYPFLQNATSWATRWDLSTDEARELFLQVSQALSKAGDSDLAQVFLIRYLATFEPAPGSSGSPSAAEVAQALPHAAAAAIGYIRSPASNQRSNVPHLAVVRALASDAAHAPLAALLRIVSEGTLADFNKLLADGAVAAYCASAGIDVEATRETMRLLTVCTIAAQHTAGTLSYDAVAEALQVDAASIEEWIVRAIARGLIDARMDQTAKTITVVRAMQREFRPDQWSSLQKRLREWRNNIETLLNTVSSSA